MAPANHRYERTNHEKIAEKQAVSAHADQSDER
jgi:hypothetical protein